MSRSHLIKLESPNLMIYRPGFKAEYLLVNQQKLSAAKCIQGENGVFVVNMFLTHESKKVCALVHKETGLCITSSQTENSIHLKGDVADLNQPGVKLDPEDDRFFYFTASGESWLFQAMGKQDTYLAIENGEATLVQSGDPSMDAPGAFLKIVNPDKH